MSVNFARLGDTLTAHGVAENDSDTRVDGEQKSSPVDWAWAVTTCQYVSSMISSWRHENTFGVKGRHGWLLSCERRLHSAWLCGCITEADFLKGRENVRARFQELRKPQHAEFWNSVQYGIDTAATKDVAEALHDELGDHSHIATDDDLDFGPAPPKDTGPARTCGPDGAVDGEPLKALFDSRPELVHIRQTARARMVSPPAVLMAVIARVLAAVPPAVQLPDVVVARGSLNLCVAQVGDSGAGKGGGYAVAVNCVDIDRGVLDVDPLYSVELGTGQGLVKQYACRRKGAIESEMFRSSVIFLVSEISSVGAHAKMQGSTTLSTLCSAWSGEALGSAYADPEKNVQVKAHTYRMCLIAGVQPLKAGALLDDADGGTPQRFVWVPADDLWAPARSGLPAAPEPIKWVLPRWMQGLEDVTDIKVCPEAVEIIREQRHFKLKRQAGALDGHALQTRLKVAAGLGLLNGRAEASLDDWELAGMVMDLSDSTRARVQNEIADDGAKRTKSQGTAEGFKESAKADVLAAAEDRAVQRVAANLLKKLSDVPAGIAGGALIRTLRSSDRKYFAAAMDGLEFDGRVRQEPITYKGADGVLWIAV